MINDFVLIIGAMKAGTTTIFDHLAGHPEVAGSRPKEPAFFAFDDVFGRGRDWYEGLFRFDPARHRFALDASTDYSKFPHCSEVGRRMREFGGRFKLIYSLRHPVRRIESHAHHVQHKGREVGTIESDRRDHSLDDGVSPVALDTSRYALQLDQHRDAFDRGDVLITSMERLSRDPDAVVNEICRFLELDPNKLPHAVEHKNPGGQQWRSRSIHPLWRAASAIGPVKSLARAFIPSPIRNRMRLRTRMKTKVEGRFKFTPQEEADLLTKLRPDLRRLRNDYRFDCKKEWGIVLD